MRAVIQRVSRACVRVEGVERGAIDRGLVVLVGAAHQDDAAAAEGLARKVASLRVFSDAQGHINLGLGEVGGAVLAIPQFTLYGDLRRGRRPDFLQAARPEQAAPLFERFCAALVACQVPVARGVFGAHMEVDLVNDGPVTLWIEWPPSRVEPPGETEAP